ncbi:glycosyltransferase family 2 protein [Polynucleobacter sp. AP-Elch-400A-B2]|uniref:glycosyltransferase family 2 protein n=1 Tax=Polynucleobacter sp. AP-Elch-400A-B2 TaxID=2576930 RepID=UPI001BFE8E1D|nr:glycosyltransferase family 2 protein [Polynucleobacter sp. AP-Elch-400A-B2]QWE24975.1 glycosyltransferase family 2 protein [Polynucleobacter sp. AP-Elch-400A-B2]
MTPKIHIILCSHNRSKKTIACITSLVRQKSPNFQCTITLFDDGSVDGTVQAVQSQFPQVNVINGDGNYFWCRSMCLAYGAIKNNLSEADFLLCVNDDIVLYPGALEGLVEEHQKMSALISAPAVHVGYCEDSAGAITYGGLRRTGQIKYELLLEFGAVADSMNFNCVLLPKPILNEVGFLDPAFEHSMGDIEYGVRISRQGVKIVTSQKVVGLCEENDLTLNLKKMNFFGRCQALVSKKYFPVRSWCYFVQSTCNQFWPIYFLYPYLRFTFFLRSK